MITKLAREAYDDYCKRKGRKPEVVRMGINTYHRLELERVDMKTMQGLQYMGCKVVLTVHKDQLQFGCANE